MAQGYGLGLGRIFNVVPAASGVHIPLTHAGAVSFVTYEDDGSTIITIKESIDGASEQNLAVIDLAHKAPGIGGTWTAISQTAAATLDLADDGTNDASVVTIEAAQLSDGFNCVEATVDGGICIAITHDLMMKRKPGNLPSNVA
jgi:hypothetical protein